MIFSVTEIQTFMRCPQKWDITSFNRQGLEPIIKAPALALGTLIHQTKELWATHLYIDGLSPNDPSCDPVQIYDALAQEALASIVMKYRAQVGANPSGAELLGVTQAIMLGHKMIENYRDYWGTPIQDDMRLLKAEQTVIVPIPGTEHYLEATLDGLMEHARTGVLYILEYKTFGAHPSLQELQRNFQFLCYIWAAREAFKQDVRGIAYDGLWKRPGIPTGKDGKPNTNRATGKPYTLDDLFLRATLLRSEAELSKLPAMIASNVMRMADYPDEVYERVVPPVRGCVVDDKSNIRLCDAIWRGEDLSYILKEYTQRQKNYTLTSGEDDDDA